MAGKSLNKTVNSGFWLQLFAGVFLITAGILGIIHYNSNLQQFGRALNQLFGKTNSPVSLIIAIVELAGGIIFILDCFFSMNSTLTAVFIFAVMLVWIIKTIVPYFTDQIFEPDFIIWLNGLMANLLFLVVFWTIYKRN